MRPEFAYSGSRDSSSHTSTSFLPSSTPQYLIIDLFFLSPARLHSSTQRLLQASTRSTRMVPSIPNRRGFVNCQQQQQSTIATDHKTATSLRYWTMLLLLDQFTQSISPPIFCHSISFEAGDTSIRELRSYPKSPRSLY